MDSAAPSTVSVLGVRFLDVTMSDALARVTRELEGPATSPRSVYFVNASTLNLASDSPAYREVLNRGSLVFGDGTGVRWGARLLHGVRLKDNVNGTDLVPRLFATTAGRGYRYFLLGATAEAIERAAEEARRLFPGWHQAGYHHGYLTDRAVNQAAIDAVNAAEPDLLLVGMGNPLQEQWIDRHRHLLRTRLCLGVGGLFTYWSGDLQRAPGWVRRAGHEWLHILVSQPNKARRYVLGNPLFLARIARERLLGGRDVPDRT